MENKPHRRDAGLITLAGGALLIFCAVLRFSTREMVCGGIGMIAAGLFDMLNLWPRWMYRRNEKNPPASDR